MHILFPLKSYHVLKPQQDLLRKTVNFSVIFTMKLFF